MSALPLLSSTELTAEQFAFARFDFNCPIAGKGPGRTVSNKKRILAAKPTIQRLIDGGQKLVIATHMGRPEGKVVDELTLDPIAAELRAQFPDVTIHLAPGIIDGPTQEIVRGMGAGEITLLQNIRFDPRETDNDEGLAREIAALPGGDGFSLYVNDAFGTCHRAHVMGACESIDPLLKERSIKRIACDWLIIGIGKSLKESRNGESAGHLSRQTNKVASNHCSPAELRPLYLGTVYRR